MSVAHDTLAEPLARCEVVLGDSPEQLRDFETWAVGVLDELVTAERASRLALQWKLMQLRLEALDLDREVKLRHPVSARSHLARLARREWLWAVLRLVDGLTEAAPRVAA